MTQVELKNYQVETLEALRAFLAEARVWQNPDKAFNRAPRAGVKRPLSYRPLSGLPDAPFVCLRLPTGGGKTLLAAHTAALAAEVYMEREFPLVLWLVPTNTIRAQTLECLRTPGNPNHEALRAAFAGRLRVLDIADFTQIAPQDLQGEAVIVVGTMQTLSVNNTDGRKVYAHHEDLERHFAALPTQATGGMERDAAGRVKFSFANLMHLHRPLVIVDEAHNFGTKLSEEVKRRVNAACVVEFTATPDGESNLLHSVSAMALKAEEMIKLPIMLRYDFSSWEHAVGQAIAQRKALEGIATGEARYIRPIVLFQAENRNENITWQVLYDHLIKTENISPEEIAVVTGDRKDLEGVDLFKSDCKIKYVITVEALKEGWDCSFAYVFCSVARVHSHKDVEQLLGRVLRLPYAQSCAHAELNHAYAYMSRDTWARPLEMLQDCLVEGMGFEAHDAREVIVEQRFEGLSDHAQTPLPPDPVYVPLMQEADTTALEMLEGQALTIERDAATGQRVAKITGMLSVNGQEALLAHVPQSVRSQTKNDLMRHQYTWQKATAPVRRDIVFAVPQLCLLLDGEVVLPDERTFETAINWQLIGPAPLQEEECVLDAGGMTALFDMDGERVRYCAATATAQLNLGLTDTDWTANALALWLDKRLQQDDVGQPHMLEFIRTTLAWLEQERGVSLAIQAQGKFLLQKVLLEKVKELRQKAREQGYQALLNIPNPKVSITFDSSFCFTSDEYFPPNRYLGNWNPEKHVFKKKISHMNGEEIECAKALDMNPQVEFWVRNLDDGDNAFRLPIAYRGKRWFYPDFLAKLTDGRILIVEYKGEGGDTTDETRHKTLIGECWAKNSGGIGLFLMAAKRDAAGCNVYAQMNAAIGAA